MVKKDVVTPAHIASRKRIGTLDSRPVFEVLTTGGFYMVVTPKGASLETLGTGSHKALAHFIAQKRHAGLQLSELAKSDQLPYECFKHLVPKYEALTDECNDVLSKP